MTDDVPNLRGSVIGTVVQVAFTIGSIVAGLAWMAAKYPDRAEFEGVRRDLQAVQQTSAVTETRVQWLRSSVEDVKQQLNRIEAKQDGQRRK